MPSEIFDAIRKGDPARVSDLIAYDPRLARECDEQGVSAIMQAKYQRQHAIVDMLHRVAGDLDVFEAAALGDIARLHVLLRKHPDVVCTYSADGFTPLHFASFFAQPKAVEQLLQHGADPNAVATNGSGLAVINSAAASGSAEVVKMVLAAGADPNTQQEGGFTPLHSAAQSNNREMVKELLEAGADPSIQANDGKTAADIAGPDVAKLLQKDSLT